MTVGRAANAAGSLRPRTSTDVAGLTPLRRCAGAAVIPEPQRVIARGLTLRPAAWLVLGATGVLLVAMVALSAGHEPAYDTVGYGVMALSAALAGALIVSRHPRHAVGWIFCAMGVYGALVEVVEGYAEQASARGWAGGQTAAWAGTWAFLPGAAMFVAFFFLFPDGRLHGRGWRLAAAGAALGCALTLVGLLLDPAPDYEFVRGSNPIALDDVLVDVIRGAGMVLFPLGNLAAIASLIVRYRRSRGAERQQLKWVVSLLGAAAVVMPAAGAFYYDSVAVRWAIAAVTATLPAAACVAILRHRLYDIDIVINRTLVYGTLTALLGSVYVVIALALGTALGRHSGWATAGATLAVAAAFRPLRARVQDTVDRRFRRAHYDGLRRVDAFLADVRAGRAGPESVEALLADVVRDPELELLLLLADGETLVDLDGRAPAASARGELPVRRGGVPIATILHGPLTDEQATLLDDAVDAAGLAIQMTGLRVELRRQLDQVAASRERIVAAGYEERRRIERDLHDGAQQRLVSIGLALRHAQHELAGLGADSARQTLDEAVAEVGLAVDELREFARGVRPAQLDRGLLPALQDLAGRVPVTVEVHAPADRYPETIEAAAYFIACEGVTNAVKHAAASRVILRVGREHGRLVITVEDDGVGGASAGGGSGLDGLADRVQAHGGALSVQSPPGLGTTLVAELPCAS